MEKKRILVIDDEIDLVEIIRSVLADEGYEVFAAYNGEEGLRQAQKVAPHLIILDMNMPKMGGVTFYHEIFNRAIERPRYPVLVVTARANLEQLFKELNVDGFMTKPFKIDDLLKEVEVITSKRYGGKSPVTKTASPSVEVENKQKKVLIVEGKPEILGGMITSFLNGGYLVHPANNAAKAIESIIGDPPDYVLLNLRLPDLPGDLLAFKFKQIPKTMDIPILLYTASDDSLEPPEEVEICKKLGLEKLIWSTDPHTLLRECNFLRK